jgi:hypothetical protein
MDSDNPMPKTEFKPAFTGSSAHRVPVLPGGIAIF